MAKKPKNSSARQLAKSIAASSIPCYLLGPGGQLLFANHPLAKFLGVPDEALVGLACDSPIAPDLAVELNSTSDPTSVPNHLAALLSCPPFSGQSRVSRGPMPIALPRQGATTSADEKRNQWDRIIFRLDSTPSTSKLCFILPRGIELSVDSGPTCLATTDENSIHQKLLSIRQRYVHLDGLTSLIGLSGLAKRSLYQTQAAIGGASSVCIQGPEGSGKRDVAHSIFVGRNKRLGIAESAAQLFPVECRLMDAGLLANLIEVMDGASPKGAAGKRQTLMLDRLDLLPQDAYAVLHSFLCNGKMKVVLATTVKPLVECGDGSPMWSQIAGMVDIQQVMIAPLKERPEDLPLIVQAILQALRNEQTISQVPGIDPAAMDLLLTYAWPNNVRELRESLRDACKGQPLRLESSHLPISIRTYASFVESDSSLHDGIDLDAILLDFEKSIIEGVLARYPGNRAHAARQLGISRTRLLRRLEQLGLSPSDEKWEGTRGESKKVEVAPPSPPETVRPPVLQADTSEDEIEFIEIDFKEAEGDLP